jgi:molybdate transport system substrate-binding protein
VARTEMHNKARWVPGIIVMALVLAASTSCTTQNSGDQSSSTKLVVLGAASLAKVFPSIGADFADANPGVSFQFSFAGTDTIAAQIEQGAKADVFAGASTSYGDQLQSDGLIDPYKPFATNQLVLVLPPSNPAHITSLEDLTGKGIKLVVAGPTVPVGAYTLKVLDNLNGAYGPRYSKQVRANVVSEETDVEGVLTKVKLGEADAAFVYVTDASAAGTDVKAVTLPDSAQAVATYPVAVVKSSTHTSMAQAFMDYLLGPAAQDELQAAGFGPPPS